MDRDLVAAALPAYEIGDELGRGAWGIVLAGEHRQLGRAVAIKQLPRAFGADAAIRARFIAEARVLASLDHPHVVPIYDFVERDGLCLLVMERLTGGTVWDRGREHRFTPQVACAVILAICAGLEHAHGRGVLHRDIKPENLMFSAQGILKVTDFGIAKLISETAISSTRAGYALGSPAYIAPEQAQGGPLSPATDVYATGTVLFELLAGELPYPATGDPVVALYQHVHEQPRRLRDLAPSLPAALDEVTARSLERDPAARFQTAGELGAAIARAASGAWGHPWLSASGITVLGAEPLEATVLGAEPSRATVLGAEPAVSDRTSPRPARRRRRSPSRRMRWIAAAVAGVSGAAIAAALVLPGHGPTRIAATSDGSAFESTAGIRCRLRSGELLCRTPAGVTASMTAAGYATIGRSSSPPPAGPVLTSGIWHGGAINCYPKPRGALSCAIGTGHGFYIDAANGAAPY